MRYLFERLLKILEERFAAGKLTQIDYETKIRELEEMFGYKRAEH